ncbi:MAG: leucine-rich repeat domain-containing protein, partial [Bacteroidota bacterium]
MTKFTKILAAVAMLWLVAVHATPLMAQQNYDFQVGQLYYNITDAANHKVAVVSGNNKPTGAIAIPATVVNGSNTYSVTSIGERAFHGCNGLTSINIPNGITSIGQYAFYGCSGLKYVAIPGHISFKDNFGSSSNIDTVIIAGGSTTICTSSFWGCSKIKYISIPNSVTSIGEWAF